MGNTALQLTGSNNLVHPVSLVPMNRKTYRGNISYILMGKVFVVSLQYFGLPFRHFHAYFWSIMCLSRSLHLLWDYNSHAGETHRPYYLTDKRERERRGCEYLAQSNPGRPGRRKLRVSSRYEQPSFCCSSHKWMVFSSSNDRSRPWRRERELKVRT